MPGVLLELETYDEGWIRMELLHTAALELGEDTEMGDEHFKNAYSTAIFFSLKKLSKKMLAWKRAIKIATCVFSPSFTRDLALKIYLEFWIFIFVQKKKVFLTQVIL